jgi:small-conductance mechanosensitive channel
LEQILPFIEKYGLLAFEYLRQPEVLVQLGLIAVAYLPALAFGKVIEPKLEERARQIRGMPGLLRLVVALLRRLTWLFFALVLALSFIATRLAAWPENNYLLYAATLLSGSWFLISALSFVIRNRALRKLFSIIAWTYVAAAILGIVDDTAAILDGAAFSVGEFRLSILDLIQSAVFIGALLWLSSSTANFIEQRIQRVEELTPSLRVLISKVLRILLIVVAVLVGMAGLGIDLTAFTVLSGAVGVGLGFGLQKVVSNFISGIIILLDESIKPGDTITLGETFGWIRELRARFVSVVTRDGREYLIPNEDFITQEVINWSFSDRYVRLDVEFGVSYDADPHEVIRLAIEAAATVDRVDSIRRKPVCWLTAFGDSSLDFVLRFWIKDPEKGLTNIRGTVLIKLWDVFKENNIGIPFPHRELIVKTPITVQPGDAS